LPLLLIVTKIVTRLFNLQKATALTAECRVGPRLLRDLWEANDSQISSKAISGWRGNPAVGVPDRTLGLLALPSYLEFAEKVGNCFSLENWHYCNALSHKKVTKVNFILHSVMSSPLTTMLHWTLLLLL
jgi:hypothetical protein